MWIRNPGTVILSIVLSVAATLALERHNRQQADKIMDVLRARRVELIDGRGQVRGEFRMGVSANGEAVPMVLLRDKGGQEAVNLYLTTVKARLQSASGQFSRRDRQRRALRLRRYRATGGSSGAWGISVTDSRHTSTRMGLQNTANLWVSRLSAREGCPADDWRRSAAKSSFANARSMGTHLAVGQKGRG